MVLIFASVKTRWARSRCRKNKDDFQTNEVKI